jgi:alpha-glucosidase/alpha-D-xyloside xylohydrolase
MATSIGRREALRQIAAASASALLAPQVLRGQGAPIVVGGKPVELTITSVSASTVRITVAEISGSAGSMLPNQGALVAAATGRTVARPRTTFSAVNAGDLVVRFTPTPPTVEIASRAGKVIQRLVLNSETPVVSFSLGDGPLLGLGEGGPQFDRKGSNYANRNGQGGYQLRTHGGRVPIQWLVGTDGWGLFFHRPLGSIDLSGPQGRLTPSDAALPLDVFVVASSDPKVIIGEYARLTGLAELPPLWSFGYMQSHRTLAGPEEIDWVARTFREKRLPCDALIYLGTEFTPSGWNTRNGEFGWKGGKLSRTRSDSSTTCTTVISRSCCTSSSKESG